MAVTPCHPPSPRTAAGAPHTPFPTAAWTPRHLHSSCPAKCSLRPPVPGDLGSQPVGRDLPAHIPEGPCYPRWDLQDLAVNQRCLSQTRPSEGTEVGVRHPLPRKVQGGAWVLTGSVEVNHEAALHVLLDQLQRPLEYLAGARLLHGVGVPRVAEQSQQVVRGAWTAGAVGAGGKRGQSETEITGTQRQNCCLSYCSRGEPYLPDPRWKAREKQNQEKPNANSSLVPGGKQQHSTSIQTQKKHLGVGQQDTSPNGL